MRVFGLSPLARGTHTGTSLFASAGRFIPAGAGNTSSVVIVWPSTAVYPRWRGEHSQAHGCLIEIAGLSPLAWGTRGFPSLYPAVWRFIPAGVGNTKSMLSALTVEPVYPRWRGEHAFIIIFATKSNRFIPAGVGNTPARNPTHRRRAVYPRWRGEHAVCGPRQRHDRGLSPLAWGTRAIKPRVSAHRRFIPAGVGNTRPHRWPVWVLAVYPRWRGEHVCLPSSLSTVSGLSPLAWGTLPRS